MRAEGECMPAVPLLVVERPTTLAARLRRAVLGGGAERDPFDMTGLEQQVRVAAPARPRPSAVGRSRRLCRIRPANRWTCQRFHSATNCGLVSPLPGTDRGPWRRLRQRLAEAGPVTWTSAPPGRSEALPRAAVARPCREGSAAGSARVGSALPPPCSRHGTLRLRPACSQNSTDRSASPASVRWWATISGGQSTCRSSQRRGDSGVDDLRGPRSRLA